MPKVIVNLRDNILSTAKAELFKNGYKEFNMRSLAKLNNTAVGTIYNYFPSKDMLVASVVLDDWKKAMSEIKNSCKVATTIDECIKGVICSIDSFYDLYRDIFKNSGLKNIRTAYPEKFEMLINTIGFEIKLALNRFKRPYSEFEIQFIVTNIFSAVTNDWPYEQTIQLLSKIVKES